MSVLHNIRVLLRWVFGWLARIVATVLILLALLVGVARLLLPEASSFKEDIRVGVKQATGLQIDFDLISAGLSVYGPELRFSRTAIQWPDGSELAAVDDIAVSLDVLAWAAGDGILPGRVFIKGTAVEVRYDEDGQWTIQGHKLQDFLPSESRGTMDDWPESTLELADVSFNFKNLQRNGPRIEGVINNFSAALDNGRVELSADLDPGISYGRSLGVEAEIPLQLLAAEKREQSDEPWSIAVVADDFRLQKWIDIAEMQNLPVVDSAGDAEVQIDFRGIQPVGLSALLELEQLQLAHLGGEAILIDWLDGEFTWRASAGGWLVKADNLLAKKIGMTQIFDEQGNVIPVTVLEAGPCFITQVKTEASDGYSAIQVGFGAIKKLNKPALGHLKGKLFRHLREFRVAKAEDYKVGQELRASVFNPGDVVSVIGTTIGKGFAGTIKKYHHHRGLSLYHQVLLQKHLQHVFCLYHRFVYHCPFAIL